MANIFLTRKCNLKCPYCFADEFVNKEYENITLKDFKTAINFIKTDPNERIGLIGGEPSLHPDFNTILDILTKDEDIKNFIIYTNGLEINKYLEKISNKKVHLLVNCNSQNDIGDKFEKLKKNIKLLANKNNNFALGINLYSDKMDYSYIFDLLKSVNKHDLRFSTAIPNTDKENTTNALDEYNKFKPFLFRFFEDCLKNEIVPRNDCNAIPACLLSIKEKKLQLKLSVLAHKYDIPDTIQTGNTCNPVIDILPNLMAVRCFGLSKYDKVPISEFKSISLLREYFWHTIDLYAKLSFENEDCANCKMRLIDKCGLCYTYKLKRMKKIKDFATKF